MLLWFCGDVCGRWLVSMKIKTSCNGFYGDVYMGYRTSENECLNIFSWILWNTPIVCMAPSRAVTQLSHQGFVSSLLICPPCASTSDTKRPSSVNLDRTSAYITTWLLTSHGSHRYESDSSQQTSTNHTRTMALHERKYAGGCNLRGTEAPVHKTSVHGAVLLDSSLPGQTARLAEVLNQQQKMHPHHG